MADTVLLVEDDTTLVSALRYNLERNGYGCLTTADGARALALAKGERPSLVLLDLMLPGVDGVEVCRRIRADSAVPIIMLTAWVEEVDRARSTRGTGLGLAIVKHVALAHQGRIEAQSTPGAGPTFTLTLPAP
jgi:DNA-binding response OmpR family regulator